MAKGEVHLGDVGTKFVFTVKDEQASGQVVVPIGATDTHEVTFERSDGTTFNKTTVREGDGTEGKVSYTTPDATILNQAGLWRAQVKLTTVSPVQVHKTTVVPFVVYENL